jgi:hypothetical protein
MPIQFPTSPTNGQVYSGYYYDATLNAWKASPIASGPIAIADTAPSGAIHGDMWYKSNDGTTYIYYNDGNTSQWVEVRSQIATSQVGLIPVVPTSLTVSSGTASVSPGGAVTFISSTGFSLNGCFSSSYLNYRILIRTVGSTLGAALYFRLRSSGTDRSSSYYYGGYMCRETGSGGVTAWSGNGTAQWDLTRTWNGTQGTTVSMDCFSPFDSANATGVNTSSWANDGSGGFSVNTNGLYSGANSNDGFTVYASSGTITGVLEVYGYN